MSLLEVCDNNPLRCAAIRAAVLQIISESRRPTVAEVTAINLKLPNFGAALQVEIDAAMAEYDAAAEAHAVSLEQPTESTEPVSVVEGHPIEEAEPVRLSQDEYVMQRRQMEIELADARRNVVLLGQSVREARGIMADALQAWVTGMPKQTFRDALMEVSRTQRANKHEQMERTPPGPSAWDRRQHYSAGRGSAPAFVEKQMRGGGNHRGALPLNMVRGPLDTAGKSKMQLRKTNTGGAS